MPGTFSPAADGEIVPGIPGACAPAILRIWQEAHAGKDTVSKPPDQLHPDPERREKPASWY